MTKRRTKLPRKPCHTTRDPLTITQEVTQLNMRYAEHFLHNLAAFGEEYTKALPPAHATLGQVSDYWQDAMQRQVLFWDTMRMRGNNYLAHDKADHPPVLKFDYEVVMDGAKFQRPVNHALVRILPPNGQKVDPKKRPFMIVDPRAGHGPGIGGFKEDSQVGVALRAGHPVYFVVFHPHPIPGQTLRDVAMAEGQFLDWIIAQHPDAPKPTVFGNCQGGWAVMGMAAGRPDRTGPLVLSGTPLAYWAGQTGKNPMRYMGGILGGSWLSSMTGDLGMGEFDGAHLVNNFESLDLANTFWSKYYALYAAVDTESDRFLDFERWWGGYSFMTTEEIQSIVDNLFIGNKLSRGLISIDRSMKLDLKSIRQPIVIFCSAGDNITPPQQALNWIADLYEDENQIKVAGQVIVYMIHPTSGHLGIFVSGAISKREQMQIESTLDQIESLPPGLYEMVIEDEGTKDEPSYDVRLEARTIKQVLEEGGVAADDSADFKAVHAISEYNAMSYQFFGKPFIKAIRSPLLAQTLVQTHPLRMAHYMCSDLNPLFMGLGAVAETVRAQRAPVDAENPLLGYEHAASLAIEFFWDTMCDRRDIASESIFSIIYGLLAYAGIGQEEMGQQEGSRMRENALAQSKADAILAQASEGDFVDAAFRIMLLLVEARGHLVRSEMDALHDQLASYTEFTGLTPEESRERLYRQTVIVAYAGEEAFTTLPHLLHTMRDRAKALKLLQEMELDTEGKERTPELRRVWQRINRLLSPASIKRSA